MKSRPHGSPPRQTHQRRRTSVAAIKNSTSPLQRLADSSPTTRKIAELQEVANQANTLVQLKRFPTQSLDGFRFQSGVEVFDPKQENIQKNYSFVILDSKGPIYVGGEGPGGHPQLYHTATQEFELDYVESMKTPGVYYAGLIAKLGFDDNWGWTNWSGHFQPTTEFHDQAVESGMPEENYVTLEEYQSSGFDSLDRQDQPPRFELGETEAINLLPEREDQQGEQSFGCFGGICNWFSK